jgi:rRNA maturation endonuclease Nob1
MPLRNTNKRRKRTVKEIFRRRERRCQRCGRQIKMGRYCYYCGRYLGLW